MEVFLEISLIIVITVLIAGIMKILKQPLIIGYIFAGILVSPYFLDIIKSTQTIETFSNIGVAFLLFIIGLSLSPKVIKEVGKVSLVTGVGQIVFTSFIGFFIAKFLGYSTIVSLYIAIALTFSSTIIIMKLLSDKKDTEKLYGKISIGFLLVQDFFVIILLMIISSFSGGFNLQSLYWINIILGISVFIVFILVSIFILPRVSNFFAKSQEFLFLFSIAWGLGLASLFHYLGFSMEIGALLAGISLSVCPFHYEISSKMRPLRDFFIIMFFILLGSQMTFGNINEFIIPALIFSGFILIGNPLIVISLMGILGYRKKVGFQSGFTVAQISEFSLILIALGVSVGHLNQEILSLITLIGLITISGSTYLILYSEKIYPYFSRVLSVFEKKNTNRYEKQEKTYDILLFGKNRIGSDLVNSLKKLKKNFLIIDYDPDIINELCEEGVDCKYGDASDEEFLNEINFSKTKMIISTIPEFETNILLINKLKKENSKGIIIVVSHNIDEAKELYNIGASYVIMPHFLGGFYVSTMINKYGLNKNKFIKERKKQIKEIDSKKQKGHEHPKHEKSD